MPNNPAEPRSKLVKQLLSVQRWSLSNQIMTFVLSAFLLTGALRTFVSDNFFIEVPFNLFTAALSVIIGLWLYERLGLSPEIYELRHLIDSAHLGRKSREIGIANQYLHRHESLDEVIESIAQAKSSISIVASIYIAELVRQETRFEEALLEAAKNKKGKQTTIKMTYLTFSPGYDAISSNILFLWAQREKNKNEGGLRDRILQGHERARLIVRSVNQKSGGKIRAYFGFLNYCFLPHSIIAIDNQKFFIGQYDWVQLTGRDVFAFLCDRGPMLNRLQKEITRIHECHVVPFRHVAIFDFDGVIFDSMIAQHGIWKAVLQAEVQKSFINAVQEEKIMENFLHGLSGDQIFQGTELDHDMKSKIRREKDNIWHDRRHDCAIFEGCDSALRELAKSLDLCIATTASEDFVKEFLRKQNLENVFVQIVGRESVTRNKPDIEMLEFSANQLFTDREKMCLVGDTWCDETMAQKFGCTFFAVALDERADLTFRQAKDVLKSWDAIRNEVTTHAFCETGTGNI